MNTLPFCVFYFISTLVFLVQCDITRKLSLFDLFCFLNVDFLAFTSSRKKTKKAKQQREWGECRRTAGCRASIISDFSSCTLSCYWIEINIDVNNGVISYLLPSILPTFHSSGGGSNLPEHFILLLHHQGEPEASHGLPQCFLGLFTREPSTRRPGDLLHQRGLENTLIVLTCTETKRTTNSLSYLPCRLHICVSESSLSLLQFKSQSQKGDLNHQPLALLIAFITLARQRRNLREKCRREILLFRMGRRVVGVTYTDYINQTGMWSAYHVCSKLPNHVSNQSINFHLWSTKLHPKEYNVTFHEHTFELNTDFKCSPRPL